MSKKRNTSILSIIKDINKIDQTNAELKASMNELKISETEIAKSISKINLLRAKLLTENAQSKSELLTRAYEKLIEFKKQNVSNAKEKLLKLLGTRNSQLQLHFSKLTDIDDKEALDMMEDAILLDLIEQLSNEK